MRALLTLVCAATCFATLSGNAQDTTQADTILDVNKPSPVASDSFKEWKRPAALNNDSLIAAHKRDAALRDGPLVEYSFGAPRAAVWRAILATLVDLHISVKKADENKGEIESESEPRATSYWRCVVHDIKGHLGRDVWVPHTKGKLVGILKEQSSSNHVLVRFRLEKGTSDLSMGGYVGRLECESNGQLETTIYHGVQARLTDAR